MNEKIIQKAQEIINLTDNEICNHCLGRKFVEDVDGANNFQRGLKIRETIAIPSLEKCSICNNIFLKIDTELIEKIHNKIDYLNIEFDTFLIGTKIPKKLIENDEALGLGYEPLKKEINREIGKIVEKDFDKEVGFEKQDIVINVDFNKFEEDIIKVRIQINPIFIEGRYNKYLRGIPQTKWPCRNCKGKGCSKCDFTGKQYVESVEELISKDFLQKTCGYDAKFHGAGREDIDVLMLGSGRPFVLEIKEPKIRNLDLKPLEEEINGKNLGKTAYHDLKFVDRSRKAQIKVSSPDTFKVYRALVECENDYDKNKLVDLKNLNVIEQFTPTRVEHRRAKKTRTKHVKDIKTNVIDLKNFEMIIKTEGGLYIKELVSGDNKRTKPSISEILGVNCDCIQLDVIEVSEY